MTVDEPPWPGSALARARGCTCDPDANHRGCGVGGDAARWGFRIRVGCPLHTHDGPVYPSLMSQVRSDRKDK